MAHPLSELIPLQSDLREGVLSTFDSVCGCGDATNRPFYDDCQNTGAAAIVEYIRRQLKPIADKTKDSEPPRKKQRTSTADKSAENKDTPGTVVVARECFKFDDARPLPHLGLKNSIRYTSLNGDIMTHVAKIVMIGGTKRVRLVISECQNDDNHDLLVDMVCDPSISNADFEAIEVIGIVSHFNLKANRPGRFWAETSFEAIPNGKSTRIVVTWELKWNTTSSLAENRRHPSVHRGILDWMMLKLLPRHDLETEITPQYFYNSIHVPEAGDVVAGQMKVDGIGPTLYPYQRRSVRWMLGREGVDWSPATDSLVPIPRGMSVNTLHKVLDEDNQVCWVSPVFDLVTTSRVGFENDDICGGLLLEEMGLGKTIEIISLILMHQRHLGQAATIFDPITESNVTPIRATLIICPPAILEQWEQEMDCHAPGLNVFTYKGVSGYKKMNGPDLLKLFAAADVVLTTYQVIAREVHHLEPPPERSLRTRSNQNQYRFSPVISPLVQFSWWRTILDEVQMIGGGISNAAHVAKMIPRVNAWGVTGTPVKGDLNGMHSLLDFLRYEPFASNKSAWKALLTRDKPTFNALCQLIAIRHTKQMVKDDISLPAQKRYVIMMPFTPIEEQHYNLIFAQMCRQFDVTETGEPLMKDWSLEKHAPTMLQFLTQLRINALYPNVDGVGASRRQQKRAEPRTAGELLQVMLNDNLAGLHRKQRELLMIRLDRGKFHALSFGIKDPRSALDVWLSVSPDADHAVGAAREQLQKAVQDHVVTKAGRSDNSNEMDEALYRIANAEAANTIGALSARLTAMLVVQHTVSFLCGNGFFALKEKLEPTEQAQYQRQEEKFYEKAKNIRQEILTEALDNCDDLMQKMHNKLKTGGQRGGLQEIPLALPGGVVLHNVAPEAAGLMDIMSSFLNQHRHLIMKWREATIKLLCRALVDSREDKDVTGEEYEQSAKDQEHVVLYVQAMRALVEDRNDVLTGGTNQLVLAEMRDSLSQAKEFLGPAPEKALELAEVRSVLLRTADGITFVDVQTALRRKMGEFRTELNRGRIDDAVKSLAIVEDSFRRIREMVTTHTEVVNTLRTECTEMGRLMNVRVEYYRQLQALSDHVQDWDGYSSYPRGIARAQVLPTMAEHERQLAEEIAQLGSMRKYLEHLEKPDVERDGLPDCLICTDKYEDGAMTICGHFFCRQCLMHWWDIHRTCPMCKKRLRRADIHKVTHKPKELKVHEEEATPSHLKRKGLTESAIFSQLPKKALDEIMNTPLSGPSWTTKVDTLCRHIIWLKKKDASTKCLVFSQFTCFLDYLKQAFRGTLDRENIKWASINDKDGIQKFKTNADCSIFLLDAKSQSSGLNLVEASHVFLVEPLINTAIELQAISRVDRIGQKKETTVWLYVVDGTVEENIYDISVRRRLEHIPQKHKPSRNISDPNGGSKESDTPELEASLEVANAAELAQNGDIRKLLNSKDKGTGEMVRRDDLMEALFANRRAAAQASKKECPRCRTKFVPNDFRKHMDTNACRPAQNGLVSANWGVIELESFPALLAYFGTDWEATATWAGTKSAAMVKGLYDRQVAQGREDWVNLARRADREAREASGGAEGHPVMQNAFAQAMAPVRRRSYGFSVNGPVSERVRRPGEGAGLPRSPSPAGRSGNRPASPPRHGDQQRPYAVIEDEDGEDINMVPMDN